MTRKVLGPAVQSQQPHAGVGADCLESCPAEKDLIDGS